MAVFHRLPPDFDVLPNEVRELTLDAKTICVARHSGTLYAFSRLCPHSGAPFCDGWVDARGHLVCPLHKYRFDMRNGYNVSGEGYRLRRFPVEQRDDGWWVGLDE